MKRKFKISLMLAFVGICIYLAPRFITSAIIEWQVSRFKQMPIHGIVVDTLFSFRPKSWQSERVPIESIDSLKKAGRFVWKCGLAIQSIDNQDIILLNFRAGCALVHTKYYATIGDTILKEKNSNLVRLKNSVRDTIINSNME